MTPAVPTTTEPLRSGRLQAALAVAALALAAALAAWAVQEPAGHATPTQDVELSDVQGKDQPGL